MSATKLFGVPMMAAAAIALAVPLVTPSAASAYDRYHHGRYEHRHHHRARVCHMEWRHHHRVRVCHWR